MSVDMNAYCLFIFSKDSGLGCSAIYELKITYKLVSSDLLEIAPFVAASAKLKPHRHCC